MSTTLTDKNSNGFPARSGVAAGDFISSAEMNQHLEALGERTNYLYTMGICPHNATFNYPIGAFCQVNGTVYRAQVGNAGEPPASNPSFWVKCPMTKDEIIADVNLGSYATTAQMNTGLSSKQNTDATLTALANLTTAADQIPYATGADTFAMTPLTPFARTLLDDANAAAALSTLGAAPLASPALTGTPTAPTPAVGTSSTQIANMAAVQAELSAQKYVSGDLVMTNGGQIVVNHNLGVEPMHISLYMRCVAAEMGYAVGDVIRIAGGSDPNGVNESLGVLVSNTQIIVRVGDSGPQLIANKANGTGGVANAANWRLIIKASK